MISVPEALSIVDRHINLLEKEHEIAVSKSLGHVLADDVVSPIDMPPFNQSAMDGYALHIAAGNTYKLIGEVQAGDAANPILKEGEAVRIFTGAAVPDTANAVMMQEKVTANNNEIVLDGDISTGTNIRLQGEQIKKRAIALKKGTKISPAAVGFLSTLGISSIKVYTKPQIAIVATGNELIAPGQSLQRGQIYESNATMLVSALSVAGFTNTSVHKVKDDYQSTVSKLKEVIASNNVVLISGGISVGDYDFVGKALNELAVQQLFYKVKQKPGKPLFFGKNSTTTIFALPGNPAASLSCFYIYVLPVLRKMSGATDYHLPRSKAKLAADFKKAGDRAQFLKSIVKEGTVTVLEGQSSAMLHTFSLANALVYIPEDVFDVKKGDEMEIIELPEV